jgi:hypothetical protein
MRAKVEVLQVIVVSRLVANSASRRHFKLFAVGLVYHTYPNMKQTGFSESGGFNMMMVYVQEMNECERRQLKVLDRNQRQQSGYCIIEIQLP